jgi:hypothetical protein
MKINMKNLLLIILIFICGKAISAQTTVITNEKGEKITEIKNQILGNSGYFFKKSLYRGSILFNEGFEMATLKIKGGQPVDTPILFNIYKDELVAKVEGKEVLFTNSDFSMRGQNFISYKSHYYELIFENENVRLLKKYNCVIKLNRGHGGLNMGGVYEGDFIRNEAFYFLFPDDKMREFTLNKASVLSVLEKRNALLAYPFNNDTLKINKVEDVISLLK